jgi:hypothetical protein
MNYFILAKIGNVNMKKTFQKTLIAAAAGVALMSAVGTASANSLLFPYFTTATGAQSVVSLSTGANGVVNGAKAATTEALHYVYNYGSTCTHFDFNGSMTNNDLLTHSVAAPAQGGFGKAIGTDTSTPVYLPVKDTYGFLVVSTRTTARTDLRGQMAIVDPATGLVVSYAAIDNAADTNNQANEGNFSTVALGGGTDVNFALTALPATLTTTSWYAVLAGDMSARIFGGLDWNATSTVTNNGFIWDNDENPYSGVKTKAVTCSSHLAQSDLMNGAQINSVGASGAYVKATFGTLAAGATGAYVVKMQAVQAAVGAPFAGKQFLHREAAGGF